MKTHHRVAEPYEARRTLELMERLQDNPDIKFLDCHDVRLAPGVGLLIDPINASPYVFVLPNQVHTFEGDPGSGTDHLRARAQADLFFERVVQEHQSALPAQQVHERPRSRA